MRARDLPALDRRIRESWEWGSLRTDEVRSLDPAMLQWATCAPSGYVREAAIRQMAVKAQDSDVGFLLLRVNDWVAPVRRAAIQALRARLRPELAPVLVGVLPLLDRMRRWQRIDDLAIIDDLERVAAPALEEGLGDRDPEVRRACALRLLRGAPGAHVIDRTLDEGDVVVRRIAAKLLLARGVVDPPLLRDRVAEIRREALIAALARGQVDASTFLADPDARIRSTSRARISSGATARCRSARA